MTCTATMIAALQAENAELKERLAVAREALEQICPDYGEDWIDRDRGIAAADLTQPWRKDNG